MANDEILYQQRRYTGLVLHHPRLTSIGSAKQVLRPHVGNDVRIKCPPYSGRALLERVQYLVDRSLYPGHIVRQQSPKQSGLFPHYLYMAQIGLKTTSRSSTHILVASPYTRLLKGLVSALEKSLPKPSLSFVAPKMPALFKHLSDYRPGLRATKVTVQVSEEGKLEAVSLSGRNPLISALHSRISPIADPLAIRIELDFGNGQSSAHADRHGNFWWYLSEQERVPNVLALLTQLSDAGLLREVGSVPLKRESEED